MLSVFSELHNCKAVSPSDNQFTFPPKIRDRSDSSASLAALALTDIFFNFHNSVRYARVKYFIQEKMAILNSISQFLAPYTTTTNTGPISSVLQPATAKQAALVSFSLTSPSSRKHNERQSTKEKGSPAPSLCREWCGFISAKGSCFIYKVIPSLQQFKAYRMKTSIGNTKTHDSLSIKT